MCVCYYWGAATAFNASARLLVSYFPLAHAILTKGKLGAEALCGSAGALRV